MSVGFIGLGVMGEPMAHNLLRGGFPLIVWNRSRGKCASLQKLGATVADTSEALFDSTRVVSWWTKLRAGIDLRNKLVHPKANLHIDPAGVAAALTGVLDCLNDLYLRVFGRPFPPAKRVLQSTLTF